MSKVYRLSKEEPPLTIICEGCSVEIGKGYTYGYMFYCEDCMKAIERAARVNAEFDEPG